jgi:hypothetical protein
MAQLEPHYEHIDMHSRYAGIFTKDFKVGDKIMWLGHDGVYGYLYGYEYTATQEHVDKKEDMWMWKKIGKIHLNKLDHNMRPFSDKPIIESENIIDKIKKFFKK